MGASQTDFSTEAVDNFVEIAGVSSPQRANCQALRHIVETSVTEPARSGRVHEPLTGQSPITLRTD